MPSYANLAHMQSTTTGTGSLTVSAVNGKQQLGTAFGTGTTTDVFDYFISNQGAAEWERGTGHMSNATTLVRDTVKESTNANALVNFSAGTKDVTNDQPAGSRREVLLANRTYYVRTDGSDSNTGLANSAGSAFLTIQKAINVCGALDISIYTVTIQVTTGTYTGGVAVSGPWVGSGTVKVTGDTTTPSNVLISVTGSYCFILSGNARLQVEGVKMTTITAGSCIALSGGSSLTVTNKVEYGAAAWHHNEINIDSYLLFSANYTISGGAGFTHWKSQSGSRVEAGGLTVTLTGTPNFGTAFCAVDVGGYAGVNSMTFSGSATGVRYSAANNGVIYTSGGGATYLPGNSAGTGTNSGTSPFGLYV